ncbi:S13-like H2TH domain-containing protein [Atractiella rhizophila]|nr:S13-like H2TH domain-containing protein [Atractiella rhizophila]
MHILGVNLPEQKILKVALTAFPGIGHTTARRLCARLSFHSTVTVGELTPVQVNALSALLSSPQTASSFHSRLHQPRNSHLHPSTGIPILQDLRRLVRNNIARHRMIGTYRGRRHAMRLPVRGQRTTTNHRTARKLNQVERYA